jgi:hypothetical protein
MEKKVSFSTYFLPSSESVIAQLFFQDMQMVAVCLSTSTILRAKDEISLDIAQKQIKMRIRRLLARFPDGLLS